MGESDTTRDGGGRRAAARASAFELKSRRFSLLGLVLHSADMAELAADWAERAGAGGFEHEPVVIDLTHLQRSRGTRLRSGFDAAGRPRAGGPEGHRGAAAREPAASRWPWRGAHRQADELAVASRRWAWREAPDEPAPERAAVRRNSHAKPWCRKSCKRSRRREDAHRASAWKCRCRPPPWSSTSPCARANRSTPRAATSSCMAVVNHGAEVIADGNIHVYAPLRGKAIAGAQAATRQARIFSHLHGARVAVHRRHLPHHRKPAARPTSKANRPRSTA